MSLMQHIEVRDEQAARLERLANRWNVSAGEAGARLLEEALRASEFPGIVFRNSPVGRQAYVAGSRLAVWEVVSLARNYVGDADKTAEHLRWDVSRVQSALDYATAFPDEINAAIAENDAYDVEGLQQLLPNVHVFVIPGSD
jgi:uncharacterized protein (DUF433 family)